MPIVHKCSGPSSVSECALPLGQASTMSHGNSQSIHSYTRSILWLKLTLRAPLTGTFLHVVNQCLEFSLNSHSEYRFPFLQTLPDLVTSLKRHSLSPRSCLSTRSAPSETFGYYNHTPSIAFRYLPPNSARFSYATEGVLFISAQLSTEAVSALRKVRVLICL